MDDRHPALISPPWEIRAGDRTRLTGFPSASFFRDGDCVLTLGEDEGQYLWVIERCPVCWQRKTDAPCCHLAVGILQESLKWASGGKEFDVTETSCIAKGDETCTITIGKRPVTR